MQRRALRQVVRDKIDAFACCVLTHLVRTVVYAAAMAIGSSSVGVFAAVNSMLVYYTMRRPPRDMLEPKLAL